MNRLILEYIIRQILQEEDYLPLKKKSFVDHPDRTRLFVDKLEKGDPIDLTNGQTVTIPRVDINKETFVEKPEKIKKNEPDTVARPFKDLLNILPTLTTSSKITFYNGLDPKKATSYKINAFAKTSELGGLGKGGSLKAERRAFESLQKQFESIKTPITLIIAGQEFLKVDGVENVAENKKADFAFTINKKPAIFISYKPGSSPRDVIFYGGITSVKNNQEVQAFIEAVRAETKNKNLKENRVEYGAPVKESEVINKTMFGSDYGRPEFGKDNVQFIIQGDNLQLKESKESYTLEASHIIVSRKAPNEGGYVPYYNARYANDRNQFNIPNCRFSVIPAGARKFKVLNLS